MPNLTEAKYALGEVRSNRVDRVLATSEVFRPVAVEDWEVQKAKERKAIADEIDRVTKDLDRLNSV